MSRAPWVSIVVPAFRAEHTLDEMIRSVLAQTVDDFELVICDDASDDRTAEVVKAHCDARIRLVSNETNQGEGPTRDHAIDAARGDWIAMLDADDAWLPDRLEVMRAAIGSDQDVMVFDDIMTCHDTPNGLIPWAPMRGARAFEGDGTHPVDLQVALWITAERLLMKPLLPRSAITRSGVRHTRRKFPADTEFFLRLLSATGLRLRYVPRAMYLYRATLGSVTAAAARPELMRECLESMARDLEWGEDVLAAFGTKVRRLRNSEALHNMAREMQQGHPAAALRALVSRPGAWPLVPRLAARRLHYLFHRWTHGGRGR